MTTERVLQIDPETAAGYGVDPAELVVGPERFDERHGQYMHHYGESLPEVGPELRQVTILPTLGEWDTIFGYFESVLGQNGVNPDERVILVGVNNTEKVRQLAVAGVAKSPDQKRRVRYYRENQMMLKLLRGLARGEKTEELLVEVKEEASQEGLDFGPERQQICRELVERKIKVVPVDMSSREKALKLGKQEKPIAVACDILGHLAWELIQRAGGRATREGVISIMNADAREGPGYVEELRSLAKLKGTELIIMPLKMRALRMPEYLDEVPKPLKLAALIEYLAMSMTSPYHSRLAYWLGFRPQFGFDGRNAMSITIRSDVLREVGGFARTAGSEDSLLALAVESLGSRIAYGGRAWVEVLCRKREEAYDGASKGIVGKWYKVYSDLGSDSELRRGSDIRKLVRAIETNRKNVLAGMNMEAVEALLEHNRDHEDFTDNGELFGDEYKRLRALVWEREAGERRGRIEDVARVVRRVVGREESVTADLHNKELFEDNPVLVEAVGLVVSLVREERGVMEELLGEASGGDEAEVVMKLLERWLPEYLAPVSEKEPDYGEGNTGLVADYIHIAEGVWLVQALAANKIIPTVATGWEQEMDVNQKNQKGWRVWGWLRRRRPRWG